MNGYEFLTLLVKRDGSLEVAFQEVERFVAPRDIDIEMVVLVKREDLPVTWSSRFGIAFQ